jgi:hypothetical protein
VDSRDRGYSRHAQASFLSSLLGLYHVIAHTGLHR